MKFFENYLGHYVHACPQIAKCMLVVFVIDRTTDHGDPWILLHCRHKAIPRVVPWGIVPTCTVSSWWHPGRVAPSREHHVDTFYGGSGYTGISPFSATGKAAAICASWVSMILLKLYWFLSVEDKVSSLTFRFSRVLSLAKSFLFIFSLILTWSSTSSLKGGWFELKFEL